MAASWDWATHPSAWLSFLDTEQPCFSVFVSSSSSSSSSCFPSSLLSVFLFYFFIAIHSRNQDSQCSGRELLQLVALAPLPRWRRDPWAEIKIMRCHRRGRSPRLAALVPGRGGLLGIFIYIPGIYQREMIPGKLGWATEPNGGYVSYCMREGQVHAERHLLGGWFRFSLQRANTRLSTT